MINRRILATVKYQRPSLSSHFAFVDTVLAVDALVVNIELVTGSTQANVYSRILRKGIIVRYRKRLEYFT